ncbi:MAG: [NiFe]-hydrogenase assembly chaperone HybE [Pseudomonadota bacterium]
MSGFEGSYLGADDKISPRAIMECKICWTPYDPEEGDDYRQVEPGTPFVALPDDWSCPNCSAPKEQFLVMDDPGSEAAAVQSAINERTTRLVTDFREIYHAKMRDVPLCNSALQVEAIGFRMHDNRPIGVLVAPWFMNIVVLPGDGEDWSGLEAGTKEYVNFPSGEYEFLHNTRELTGGYKACSLFSPMSDFKTQAQAVAVAEAVMVALFDEENRAETDRAHDIRAARTAEVEAADARKADAEIPQEPTRRNVISVGMAQSHQNEG